MNFKEMKFKIKQEQKELAHSIRVGKQFRKLRNYVKANDFEKDCVNDISWNSHNYRHYHIAYCTFFNNTPYEKIEFKCKENPNSHLIETIISSWKKDLDEIVHSSS